MRQGLGRQPVVHGPVGEPDTLAVAFADDVAVAVAYDADTRAIGVAEPFAITSAVAEPVVANFCAIGIPVAFTLEEANKLADGEPFAFAHRSPIGAYRDANQGNDSNRRAHATSYTSADTCADCIAHADDAVADVRADKKPYGCLLYTSPSPRDRG